MNKAATINEVESALLAEPGYAGKILIPGQGVFGIIAAPKATGEHKPAPWGKTKKLAEAMSFYDGIANTEAMAKAGSKLAQWALDQALHIPSRDELELLYRTRLPQFRRINVHQVLVRVKGVVQAEFPLIAVACARACVTRVSTRSSCPANPFTVATRLGIRSARR